MVEVLVFGGTSEGRELAEWLAAGGVRVVVCCATEYGGELVSGREGIEVVIGPLDDDEKKRLVESHSFSAIVDATHPYATHITESIKRLSLEHGLKRIRLVREDGPVPDGATCVDSVVEAAQLAASRAGNVLLTTGSKDLGVFTEAICDFAERLFVRVLPVPDSIAHTRELGIPASRVVAMQGPFSEELNVALLRDLEIRTLVTKASGKAGGFDEKLRAAKRCDVEAIIIGRPETESGLTLDEVKRFFLDAQWCQAPLRKKVYLVGMGPGDFGMLTRAAREAIEKSELLIGAPRLIESAGWRDCEKQPLIRTDEIVSALRESGAGVASVLFSGDVGFYSGATALADKLAAHGEDDTGGVSSEFDVEMIPGISSLVYFCAKLLVPWQDAHLVSAHGRESDPAGEVATHAKTFFLTGGKTSARDVCSALTEAGLGNVNVAIGERLSYADERITQGTACELAEREFGPLAVMLVENPDVSPILPGKLN